MGYGTKYVEKYGKYLYFVFRVFVGLLFLQHGGQKLFGWFGGQMAPLFSLMGIAGLVEFVAGIAIAVGFFTRLAAAVSGLQMLVAFFMVHFPNGWIPLVNKGELALLFFAAFLMLVRDGNGLWSAEKSLLKKEVF